MVRIGAFELAEPAPELNEPHALTIIPSWMDAGASAGMTLSLLEKKFEAKDLARLARPENFSISPACGPLCPAKAMRAC